MTVCSALLIIAAGLSWFSEIKASKVENISILQNNLVNQVDSVIQTNLSWPRFDISYLANSAAIQNYLTDPSESSLNKAKVSFSQLQASRAHLYAQVRYIDDEGQEIIRVEQDGRLLSNNQLQNKKHRYYFKDAMELDRDQIGMSPLDLNVDQNQIEQPLNPMIRFYTRVVDSNGKAHGVIVINYKASTLLSSVAVIQSEIPFWWMNEQGYWFSGVPDSQRWGFMYPDRQDQSLKVLNPKLWQAMQAMISEGENYQSFQNGLLFARQVQPTLESDSDNTQQPALWLLVSWVPEAGSWGQALSENKLIIIASFLIFGLFSSLSFKIASVSKRQQELVNQQLLTEQESRQKVRFEAIFESSPSALIIVDDNGTIRQHNQSAINMFGYTAESLAKLHVSELIPSVNKEKHAVLMREAPQNKTPGYIIENPDASVHSYDGSELPVDIRLTPFMLDNEQVTLATITDISEKQRLLNELQDALLRLNEANAQLESRVAERTRQLQLSNRELESFAYAVSHDLRAPLRSLDGFSKLLLLRHSDSLNDAGKDFLERIRVASQKMGELIDDILLLSRISRHELLIKNVSLSSLAKSIVSELQTADPERLVIINIEPEVEVTCDKRLTRVLLTNLLSNAWKYTSKEIEPQIDFYSEEDGGYRWFVIKDNGSGFDMKFADSIFKPFQRLHDEKDFSGHGIGLSTAMRVIEKHNGEIIAYGKLGAGAEFRFRMDTVNPSI